MKMLIFALLFICFSNQAFAGSAYEYVGSAQVSRVSRYSASEAGLVLKITKMIAMSGSAAPDSLHSNGFVAGNDVAGTFAMSKKEQPKNGDLVYFSCSWHCGAGGCSDRHWRLLSEKEASSKH